MQRYDGRVAVVTGASSGIGRQLAVDLAARGATVLGLARREPLLAELRPRLRQASPRSDVVTCDVANVDTLLATLTDIEKTYEQIDVLVNNAGVDIPTPVGDNPARLEVFADIMATNYFAVVAGTLAVLPGMLQRRSGIIVNVSSDSARAPEPRDGGYAASKAAVSAFTESVAHEVAGRGVHVHVLYPAWVPTAMGTAGEGRLPPKLVRRTEALVSNLLLEQMGRPRVDINAAWLPKLAVIGRTIFPGAYQRSMRRFAGNTDSSIIT
jgi:short-subunit dehydrogenase